LFSSSSPISLFLFRNSTIIAEQIVKSSLSVSLCHNYQLILSTTFHWVHHTLSAAYTEHSIRRVKHTPSTAYAKCSVHLVQHSRRIVCHPFILKITSWPLTVASASGVPPYRSTATSQLSRRASNVKSPGHIPTVSSQLYDEFGLSTQRATHRPRPDRPLPSSPPISFDHSQQVHLQTPSITASKCISEFS
jgi:hypothetical protein